MSKNTKNTPVVAPAPVVAPSKAGVDMFGVRLNARGYVIDAVIIDAAVNDEGPLSVKEITRRVQASPLAAEYLKATGRPVNAISNHVLHVYTGGHVVRDAKLGGYAVNLERHGDAIKALKATSKPARPPKKK